MLDVLPLCCTYRDESFELIDCNFAAVKLFGFKDKQEYLARQFDISPEYQPDGRLSDAKAAEMIKSAYENGHNVFEWMHQTLDGQPIPTEVMLVRVDVDANSFAIIGYMRDLREALASRARVNEAEKWAQIMLDAMPLACHLWDENHNLLDCSFECARLFEHSSKQEHIDHFFELLPQYQSDGKPSKEKLAEMFNAVLDHGYAVFEWAYQKLDGELIPAEVILILVEKEGRNVIASYTKDLREVKAAEARAKEAEKYRKLMFDSAPLYCTLWDENFNIIECDAVTLRLFGLKNRQDFLDRFFEFSPKYQPDGKPSKEKMYKMFDTAMKKGRCVFEWAHQRPFGSLMPYEMTLVRAESDGRKFIAGFGKNLSELKTAEAKLKEADEMMKIMFDVMPLGCVLFDERLKVADCNNEILRLFDIEDKQDYLDRFFDLSPEFQPDGSSSKEKAVELINYTFKHGRIVFEWVHKNLNGNLIPSEITLVRARRGDGYIVVGYVRDLREIKDKSAKLGIAEKLAFSDSLTGIYNRRYFMQFAAQAFDVQDNAASHLGVIMLDIDHFKKVNDRFGHEAGDAALKAITNAVQSVLRESDLFARYGGEEFVVLAQYLDLADLTKLAWRICKKVESLEFFYNEIKIRLTISAGVAIRQNINHTLEMIIRQADAALYKAKANGRNRTEVSSE